jgi:hypothetical protein
VLSSISSSEAIGGRVTRATWALIAAALLVYAGAEAAASVGLGRISRIHQRIMIEKHEALLMRHSPDPSKRNVLFLGNSLLLEGVDFPRFANDVSPRLAAKRFVVESTYWYDLFYALKGMLRMGMRPDDVVIALNPPQFISPAIRGAFSARFLFNPRDLWSVSRVTRSDMTQTSELYFAHFSNFYGSKSELRGVLMGKIAPAVPRLWQDLTVVPGFIPTDVQVTSVAAGRFRELRVLCGNYGVNCLALIPPTAQNGEQAIVNAGDAAGLAVMHPVHNFSVGPELYRDSFHLNHAGAEMFTDALERASARIR